MTLMFNYLFNKFPEGISSEKALKFQKELYLMSKYNASGFNNFLIKEEIDIISAEGEESFQVWYNEMYNLMSDFKIAH